MYDSFDMACHDASSALRLNIKVNSENLLPHAQKYNVGSLRLPADPSWPKIPQRRMVDDLGGIIEPPCVVTLTGTPRKSRTTVKASHFHQSTKFSYSKDQVPASFHHNNQKVTPTTHPLKRRPGCADPRFKRVTTVKSDVTSNDQPGRENHTDLSRSAVIIPNQTQCTNENVRKTVPEKDTDPPKITQQEAEKPGELRGMDSRGVQTMSPEESSKIDVQENFELDTNKSNSCLGPKKILCDETELEHHKISTPEIGDSKTLEPILTDEKKPVIDSKSCADHGDVESLLPQKVDPSKEKDSVSNLTTIPSNPVNVQTESTCLKYCQSNAGQFFLVMENKSQAQTLSALQHDPTPVSTCQYTTQCYNVQVPVLTYQNLPLQISTQKPTKVEIPSQLSLSPVLTIPSTPAMKNLANVNIENPGGNITQISKVSDIKINTEKSEPLQNLEEIKKIPNSGTPEKSVAQSQNEKVVLSGSKDICNPTHNQEEIDKHLIESDVPVQLARKTLGTPPIKLGRKYDNNHKFEDVRVQHFMSDTTDSELYGINGKQTKPSSGHLYNKETSCSGSDCDLHFHHQSKYKNDLAQLKKKRRKPIYSSTGIRKYDENCTQAMESSMDDQESIKPRDNCKQLSRTQRKMKSEQNLSRYLPCGGKNYKNISDPHLATRDSYRMEEETFYPSSCPNTRCKCENRYQGEMSNVGKFNNRELRERTSDVDSDAVNTSPCCDSRRTDLSNIEESRKPTDSMPTALPAKTQQLLNKSYMEYYDKLRSSNVEKNENPQQRYVCQMAIGTAQLKKRRAESNAQITKIDEQKESIPENLTMEKLSALSNIINRNLNPALKNSSDALQTTHLYVNDNMKSSSDPTAVTESAVLKKVTGEESADLYDSSVPSVTLIDRVKRKGEKPVEKRLLKLKTIVFFGFMMYAMVMLLPLMYNFFLYDDYEDYEDLSYIELTLEYVVSSFREAFGGLFDAISDLIIRPVRLD